MKQFNLEEYLKLKNEGKEPRIVTRDNQSVRIICTDKKSEEGFHIIGLMRISGENEGVYAFHANGSYTSSKNSLDLFFADPEPKYRPYKNAEECFRDILKHGGWTKYKNTGDYYYITYTCDDRDFANWLEKLVWADDGSPVGVKED